MRLFHALPCIFLFACGQPEYRVTETTVEQLRIGMSTAQVQQAYPAFNLYGDSSECQEGGLDTPELRGLFEQNKLVRVYIRDARYRTGKGIGIGSSEDEVKAAYGNALTIEPHKYDEFGKYISLIRPDGSGFLFETDKTHRVVDMSIGVLPALQYVEGCL